MKRRRRCGLGRAAREGERTGVIPPPANLDSLATDIVEKFEACENPRHRRPAPSSRMTSVPNAATGAAIRVVVEVKPSDVEGQADGSSFTGRISDRPAYRYDVVTVKPMRDLCDSVPSWRRAVRSVLAHELAHVADPTVKREKDHRVDARTNYCAYMRQPREVTAFLAQVRDDLTSDIGVKRIADFRRRGYIKSAAEVLTMSDRWHTLNRCLTTAQKKRFYRVAADLWQRAGDLGGSRRGR